jgi:hypothetical protein
LIKNPFEVNGKNGNKNGKNENSNNQKDVKKKNQISDEEGLFELFLSNLDLAAKAFSHLEYSISLSYLKEALKIEKKLQDLVETIIKMRTGVLTCKDMRKETKINNFKDLNGKVQINKENSEENSKENHKKSHEKGDSEKMNERRKSRTWFFGILGAVFIGGLIGYDVSTTKVKRGIE